MNSTIIQQTITETNKIMTDNGATPAVIATVNSLINNLLSGSALINSLRSEVSVITHEGFSLAIIPEVVNILLQSKTYISGLASSGVQITSDVLEHLTFAVLTAFLLESNVPTAQIEEIESIYAGCWKLVCVQIPKIINACVAKVKANCTCCK